MEPGRKISNGGPAAAPSDLQILYEIGELFRAINQKIADLHKGGVQYAQLAVSQAEEIKRLETELNNLKLKRKGVPHGG